MDNVIPQYNLGYTVDRISSRQIEIVKLDNSYHVATIDFDKEIINSRSVDFIRRILQKEKNDE